MRHIDKSKFANCKTKTWDKKSKEWTDKVQAAADPRAQIKEIGNKWSSLKRTFIKQFGAKCWYTECPQIGTDFDVDHYWPKGRVKDASGTVVKNTGGQHPGYWWMAFDINNYRYSCIYANRGRDDGGKVDYFPISDETKRSWNSVDTSDYNFHQILDPCCLDDVKLLSFEVDSGITVSAVSEDSDPLGFEKVKLSKKLLNLDHDTITPNRLRIIKDTKLIIGLLKLTYRLTPAELDAEELDEVVEAKKRLIELCDRKSQFSAAAVQNVLPNKSAPYLADIIGQLDLTL